MQATSSSSSTPPSYCLSVRCEQFPDLKYVFKPVPGETRTMDPDLLIPYDVDYKTDCDAQELKSRLFSFDEAVQARAWLLAVPPSGTVPECYMPPEWEVDLVQVDEQSPLHAFQMETRLLRLLPWWKEGDRRFDDLSFAWVSSRADGARTALDRVLYRRRSQPPQLCYEVSARYVKSGEEATVSGRCGHPLENPRRPGGRAERFGAIEWGYPFLDDYMTEVVLVSAARALTQEQATAMADALRADADFVDVRVTAKVLSSFAADEGMTSAQPVSFTVSTGEFNAAAGFDSFLSVWRDDEFGGEAKRRDEGQEGGCMKLN